MHLSYLGPVSCVFISWVSSGCIVESGCSLMAARWQVFFSFLSFFRAHWFGSGWNHWWLWHPLFTDMSGRILFLNTMNIHLLLKAQDGEYSFLWSTCLKYLWKLTTKYMKASFNLISRNQVLSQNLSSLKDMCPSLHRHLHLRGTLLITIGDLFSLN